MNEELKQQFKESLKGLLMDKIAQDDPETVDFYMRGCVTIAEDYADKAGLKSIRAFQENVSEQQYEADKGEEYIKYNFEEE